MLRETLQTALKNAMKTRDTDSVGAIRLIIAGQKEKDVAARGAGKEQATDAELLSMIQTMIKQRHESVKIYNDANRPELAQKEQTEINIIEKFLPKQMSEDEVKTAIAAAITSINATSIKDMGKVMALLKDNYAGQLDFGRASGTIKEMLNK